MSSANEIGARVMANADAGKMVTVSPDLAQLGLLVMVRLALPAPLVDFYPTEFMMSGRLVARARTSDAWFGAVCWWYATVGHEVCSRWVDYEKLHPISTQDYGRVPIVSVPDYADWPIIPPVDPHTGYLWLGKHLHDPQKPPIKRGWPKNRRLHTKIHNDDLST